MDTIIITIIATCAIGMIAAVLLVIASKLMYVPVDKKMERVREELPGANCGVCGYSGCDSYAQALSQGKAEPDLCRPGGAALTKKLGEILGIETGGGPAKKIAIVRCSGDANEKIDKIEYVGITSCFAAEQQYGGQNACSFGCLGFGDCKLVCPKDAICVKDGLAHVDVRKCIGCEKCVGACPRGVIRIVATPVQTAVLCCNTEKGAVVRKKCAKGCIACSKCVRECPAKAITVSKFLAQIDNAVCVSCGHCAEVCMTGCIAELAIKD